MKVFYFGCMDRPGHHMHSNPPPHSLKDRRALHDFTRTNPWGLGVDAGLCPLGEGARSQPEGLARVHHKGGWTALAFWDRSVDSRGGSNSAFLAEGTHDFDAMLTMARDRFPHVMARFKFPIVAAEPVGA